MKTSHRSRVCVICILLGLVSGLAHAASRPFTDRPWGQMRPYKQGPRYDQVPRYDQNSYSFSTQRSYRGRQRTPQWGNPAGQRPYQQAPTTMQSQSGPYVETAISDKSPHVQQGVLYTLRVAGSTNLRTIEVNLPSTDSVTFQKIDGPVTATRNHKGRREIVNEYHYVLTPLRQGRLTLPPVRVTGTLASDQQWSAYTAPGASRHDKPFDIRSRAPLTLRVEPTNPTIRPWLAAHELRLQGGVDGNSRSSAGDPLTLSVELVALGAAGEQLPSLESQLQTGGFRAYREDSWVRTEIAPDGKTILGKRSETYTLVPNQDGGRIQVPHLSVAWWNSDTGTKQFATLGGRGFAGLPGAAGGEGQAADALSPSRFFPWASPMAFWAPLLLVLGVILAYWTLVWGRGRDLGGRAKRLATGVLYALLGGASRRINTAWTAVWARISPVQCCRSISQRAVAAMPERLMVWFCARCARNEDSPSAWCQEIRGLMRHHLDIPGNAPLQAIADKIIELHPRPDSDRVHALMRDLDGAIYGGAELDFEAWKKSFGRQVSPALLLRRRRHIRSSARGLPELNPRLAA